MDINSIVAALRNRVNTLNERAGEFNKRHAAATDEWLQTGKLGGPKQMALTMEIADAYNPGGIFIGSGAKTWNQAAAEKAKELAKKGADPRKIWKEAGTFKGPDGHWRQEIDDSVSKWTDRGYQGLMGDENLMRVDDAMAHAPLSAAYPDMTQKTGVMFTDGGLGKAKGNYDDGLVTLDRAAEKDTLLHELQHAIQQREGWSAGGSPAKDSMDTYRRLAGEAEARATQARLNMSEAQRREVFPLDSYDVPIDELIVRALRK